MSDDTQQPIVVKKIKKDGGRVARRRLEDRLCRLRHGDDGLLHADVAARLDHPGRPAGHRRLLPESAQGFDGRRFRLRRFVIVIQGGGKDLTASVGQVKAGDVEAPRKTINLQKLKAEYERVERQRLEGLKADLET
jgi:hypothetical protein